MSLIPLRPLLEASMKYGFGQGAFNVNAVAQAKAAIEVHEMFRSAAILQGADLANGFMGGNTDFIHATLEDKKIGARNIAGAVKKYAQTAAIPVVLHLDHGRDFDSCVAAIEGGYTSVMIDGSFLPFDENVELTREVVKYAHARGVSVEGELGVSAEASVAIQITPNDKVPQGSELLEEWDIGMTANECYARLYRTRDGGTLLSLEGEGICKEFDSDEIPWNAYMGQITACQIEETMKITAMDGWFEQAVSLKTVPRLPATVKSLSRTFAGCRSLTAGTIPVNAQNVEGMYRDCVNLQYVNQMPESVENCRETFETVEN